MMTRTAAAAILAPLLLLPLLLLPLLAILFTGTAWAADAPSPTEVILIVSPGCTKCAAAERALNEIGEDQGVNLTKHEYFTDEGKKIIKEHRAKDIPAIIIGSTVINSRDYEEDDEKMRFLIRAALENETAAAQALDTGGEREEEPQMDLSRVSPGTLATVFTAGLVAGFNPCLLGILVFLAATVMSSSSRRRDLIFMIISFSLGIFAMYLAFGLGMQRVLQAGPAVDGFRYALTGLLIVIGLLHIEDARRLHSGGNSMFRGEWAMKYIKAGASRGSIPSYFLMGALFSLVKAPCVGAVYLAILDVISGSNRAEGAVYLVFYNLGIILPIIILGGLIALGLSPEQVDRLRKDYRAQIRLVTGVALLALAPLIYYQLI